LVVSDRELLAHENKRLQNLAIATGRLADILREKNDPTCIQLNEEAITLYQRIEDRVGTSIRLLNLGHAFKNIRSIEDLDKAEDFYRKTFDSYPETDSLARAQALGQIGAVYLKRVEKRSQRTINSGKAHEELDNAIACYEAALELLPQDAFNDLIIVHNQLGASYRFYRDGQETALDHFKRAMRFADNLGDQMMSAGTRSNIALILHNLSRNQEAGIYAAEALTLYEDIDPKATLIPQLKEFIAEGGRYA
jgi:tetratricopeptide (TPR) repeat protein